MRWKLDPSLFRSPVAIAIDPVTLFMWGNGRIPSTVDHYYDYFQTNPDGGVGPFFAPNLQGIIVDSDAVMNTYDDLFTVPDKLKDTTVNHKTIVADVYLDVVNALEGE